MNPIEVLGTFKALSEWQDTVEVLIDHDDKTVTFYNLYNDNGVTLDLVHLPRLIKMLTTAIYPDGEV